jgi:hypothetical protein
MMTFLDMPGRRYSQSMIATQNDLIIFGGGYDLTAYNDVWRFDLTAHAWEQILAPCVQSQSCDDLVAAAMPYNRTRHSALPISNGMIVFGGEFSPLLYFNDIWVWHYNATQFKPIERSRGLQGVRTYIDYYN